MKTSSLSGEISEQRGEQFSAARRRLVLPLLCIAVFLDALDTSIVNVALPSIQHDLRLTTLDLPWVAGIYFLLYAGFLLLGGRAADLLGRRRIFMVGSALFGLASFICGLANDAWLLLLARALQGLGAALTLPAAISIITTTFAEGPERNKALSIFSATGASGFSFGLVLGGVLTTFISWHWIFFVNVPFALLILLLVPHVVKESRVMTGARSYDIAGAVTVTAGLLLLGYAITQANQPGATPLMTVGLLVLALVVLAVFILVERRAKEPLIPLRIFRSKNTVSANLASFTLLGPFFSFLFIAALYLQDVLHYSPVLASLALLPGSVLTVLVSRFVTPRLLNALGVKLSSVIGLLCMASGVALLALIGPNSDYLGVILLPMLLVMGLGLGIGYPALAVAAVSGISDAEQGLAAGLQGTALQAGGGLWLAIMAAVVTVSAAAAQGVISGVVPSVSAQLSGFHAGLLVAAAGAVLGAIIALIGIQGRPAEQKEQRSVETFAEDKLSI
ncbi:MFS transporter [Ktedonosporobacter rubrisoli]|uniref:MFS transporter n=1 Tax=Ktedonosporobacter rubrisoli TaxID=2509675 RepID=A0A4P6JWB7_KTERU|nr:MFS transporter [Ktedonosporobacter rubrisoli]QBD79296.1 MFS transporter [Ktedonosporobacter rubrisoli]